MALARIYLETTMFNFPFVDDAPQYRADTERLASIYVAEGVIPAAYETDALHIAAATVNRAEVINYDKNP
jgi:hypothetical protein